jgi:hypothetical protein
MGIQLPLAGVLRRLFENHDDPHERLARLRSDVSTAKAMIRDTLDKLAERHGIPPADIDYAMEGYASALLDDAVGNLEGSIEREIEDDDPE